MRIGSDTTVAPDSGLLRGRTERRDAATIHDDQIGLLFRQMRAATGLPPGGLAAELGISERTLGHLEQGAIGLLPDWPETLRIVTTYCRIVRIDCEPVLRRIKMQRSGLVTPSVTSAAPTSSSRTIPTAIRAATAVPAAVQAQPARRRARRAIRRARRAFAWVSVPMFVAGAIWYVAYHSSSVHAAIGRLPEPLPHFARAGVDLVLTSIAPVRADGLRLIDSDDPRSRKTDKLPVKR
jgi:DNA-binding XRE family transcriptional regulator